MPVSLTIFLSEKISGKVNEYIVLETGKFASAKYSGVLSAKNPTLEEKPGIIEVKQDWIDAVVQNYEKGYLETVPFADEIHERGISLGPIVGVVSRDGKLVLRIDWNERGKDYIKKNEYMYLSIDVNDHLLSKDVGPFKMGDYVYPVLRGVGICNDPVFKNQQTLQQSTQFSEKGAATANKILIFSEHKFTGGNLMKELFTKFLEAVKAAVTGNDAEAAKTEIQSYISELQKASGAIDPAMKAAADEIGTLKQKVQDLEGEKTTLSDKIKMSEGKGDKVVELSNRLTESEKRNSALIARVSGIEFDNKYLNKKVTPEKRDRYFKLYLADREETEKILADLPDIAMGDNELGSDRDASLNNGGTVALETQFAEESKKIQSRDKISFSEAYNKCKTEKADLWKKLNEGGSK